MQIIIDTRTDSPAEIRAAVAILTNHLEGSLPAPPTVIPATHTLPPSFVPPPPPVDNAHVAPGATPFVPPPPMDAATNTNTAASGPAAGAAPAATSTAFASELDSAGLPWDARIHSEAKKRNADGTWRYRRGLADEMKTAVTSELRMKYPQQTAAPPPPPPAVSLPAPPAVAVVPPPPPATVIPPAVGTPPPPVAAGVLPGPVSDFKSLMAKAGALMQAGKLTHPQLAQACVACGVASLPALMSQPDKIPAVNAWLDANVQQ